mgnify:CR=1 FL=1
MSASLSLSFLRCSPLAVPAPQTASKAVAISQKSQAAAAEQLQREEQGEWVSHFDPLSTCYYKAYSAVDVGSFRDLYAHFSVLFFC